MIVSSYPYWRFMNKVLIIDDEDQLRGLLSRIIGLEGYEVFQADSCKNGLKQLALHDPDVVLCDVRLPDGNGVELIAEIKRVKPLVEVIMLTAHGNIPDGVQAIKNGAFDYLTKGDDNNRIIPLISRAMDPVAKVKQESQAEIPVDREYSFDTILGSSMAIREAIALAKKVSVTDVPVLLTGETGTGKEVFAQAIHRNSERAKKSFVAVNCAAFSKELLESEMFGHKAGSFTGALKDKKGLFEEANHGTIFLDEIGEMAFDLQAKLLRILEAGEFIKIGDTKPTKVDVRAFVQYFGAKMKKKGLEIHPDYMECLKRYGWHGNVRELRNVVERSIVIAGEGQLTEDDLPLELRRPVPAAGETGGFSDFDMANIEKNHIRRVLQHTGGNKTEAARLMRIGLTTLYRKIEEYGLGDK